MTKTQRFSSKPNGHGALRLSLVATRALTDSDVMFVGQLQDRMLAAPAEWWKKFQGLTDASAAAIADQLAEFLKEVTGR